MTTDKPERGVIVATFSVHCVCGCRRTFYDGDWAAAACAKSARKAGWKHTKRWGWVHPGFKAPASDAS